MNDGKEMQIVDDQKWALNLSHLFIESGYIDAQQEIQIHHPLDLVFYDV